MERKIDRINLLALALVLLKFAVGGCFCLLSFQLPDGLENLYISSVAVNTGNGEVFVAVDKLLLRLDSQLNMLERLSLDGTLIQLALSPNNEWLIGCAEANDDEIAIVCSVYESADLRNGPTTRVITAGDPYNLGLIVTNNSFYLGSTLRNDFGYEIRSNSFHLSQYYYTSNLAVREGYYNISSNINRLFYGGFSKNNFGYYFVTDFYIGSSTIRVLRLCDCEQSCSSREFEALYELELQCCNLNQPICYVTLIEPTVIVYSCSGSICGYLLSTIDRDMDTTYEECANNDQINFKLSWELSSRPCTEFSVSII